MGIQFNSVKPTVHLLAAIISYTINMTHQSVDRLLPLQDQASSAEYHHLTIKKGGKATSESRKMQLLMEILCFLFVT